MLEERCRAVEVRGRDHFPGVYPNIFGSRRIPTPSDVSRAGKWTRPRLTFDAPIAGPIRSPTRLFGSKCRRRAVYGVDVSTLNHRESGGTRRRAAKRTDADFRHWASRPSLDVSRKAWRRHLRPRVVPRSSWAPELRRGCSRDCSPARCWLWSLDDSALDRTCTTSYAENQSIAMKRETLSTRHSSDRIEVGLIQGRQPTVWDSTHTQRITVGRGAHTRPGSAPSESSA